MRGYACVALHQPKSPQNVGGALRAVTCFGADLVIQAGEGYQNAPTNTYKTENHVPLLVVDDVFDALPYGCVPVAVEIVPDAEQLPEYVHPERACYIFGPEDGSLPSRIVERCRDKVVIPSARCLNLASAVNVVLYDRAAKRPLAVEEPMSDLNTFLDELERMAGRDASRAISLGIPLGAETVCLLAKVVRMAKRAAFYEDAAALHDLRAALAELQSHVREP